MTCAFAPFIDTVARRQKLSRRFAWVAGLVLFACCLLPLRAVSADALARANAAYSRGDYIGAVRMLTPLALRGNAKAQAFLGFMYENGRGVSKDQAEAIHAYMIARANEDWGRSD